MTISYLKLNIKRYRLQQILENTFIVKKYNRLKYTVYHPIFSKSLLYVYVQ